MKIFNSRNTKKFKNLTFVNIVDGFQRVLHLRANELDLAQKTVN